MLTLIISSVFDLCSTRGNFETIVVISLIIFKHKLYILKKLTSAPLHC